MRKIGLLLAVLFSTSLLAQRYGVVDTDYILKNLPEYAQAKAQVDQLSTQWAGEVSALQSDLQSLKDALAAEQILLSPEKLEKREAAIVQKAEEVLALQQKYFGPEGMLFEKRTQLVQPIQDKVFGAVQALAQKRKLELVLDKSAQSGVLFVEKEKDYSEEVLNSLKK
ncbi:MAG: OmpH family outer membrane protein [Schleiferiaceae bacterium]|nr:OmpH family outer membrane protein [Bacteroidota bacterium]MCH1406804.1 OmpH family outer membrane protein [Schleiferiaceae bacterium]MDA7804893.1 OmpH family outer membrane protein [Schleiferiaceae bacterium]MDA8564560.1 OmpH family outer membrane protein [Schleiferiaceae bacterium]MDA9199283.1 OmpH family outer membrane protein [Schleiferiaceae bacterium]